MPRSHKNARKCCFVTILFIVNRHLFFCPVRSTFPSDACRTACLEELRGEVVIIKFVDSDEALFAARYKSGTQGLLACQERRFDGVPSAGRMEGNGVDGTEMTANTTELFGIDLHTASGTRDC